MKSIVTMLLILGTAGWNPSYGEIPDSAAAERFAAKAAADCESACYLDYQECYFFDPVCPGEEFCAVCEDEYQWCLEGCQQTCFTDVCTSCNRPAAVDDEDGDQVPDRLEYDLAHQFFPHIMLQHQHEDLNQAYLHSDHAIPYTVAPLTAGICNEDRECLEIRYGIAYHYDFGDDNPIIPGDHLGDSEFYTALVMRTTSWSTASTSASSWQLIRDFTAAHWGVIGDSSRVGAYGHCFTPCQLWDQDGDECRSHSACGWFPGLCTGIPNQPWDFCSNYGEDGPCTFAGCIWMDPKCSPPAPLPCYLAWPLPSGPTLYASERKHGLYHTDFECDDGGFLDADDCPYNQYDLHSFKGGKLQNIGQVNNYGAFDTVIQHPDGCTPYNVWDGTKFGDAGRYKESFLYTFNWHLPESESPSGDPSGNPFFYANARDQFLACYGMAGRISSNCRDISVFDDKQMCYSMSLSTQSYCTQITDRNLQLACYGMSINYSSNCRDITDPAMKDFCDGVSRNNSSYCYNITDTDTRLLCLALATDSASHCSGISSSNDRQFCSGVSSLNNSYCASIQ
ncbi:MAG: hypothetical protein GY856_29300 [bacterium]|nr:hypothetical protein [bacterium]